jgi:hypothetical protein
MPLKKIFCEKCHTSFSLFLSYKDIFSSQPCPGCNTPVVQISASGVVSGAQQGSQIMRESSKPS